MSNMVAFPTMPLVGADMAAPIGVVVAPLGSEFIAWVRTERGSRLLERSPELGHALADGRVYAARHGVPFRFQGAPFRGGHGRFIPERGGEISVCPGPQGSEAWEIVHVPPSRGLADVLARAASFDAAEGEAQRIASDMHAAYLGAHGTPTPSSYAAHASAAPSSSETRGPIE